MYYIEAQNNDQLNDSTQQKSQLTNTVKLQTLSNYKHDQIMNTIKLQTLKLQTQSNYEKSNCKHNQITNKLQTLSNYKH